jgi:hypothetical protein
MSTLRLLPAFLIAGALLTLAGRRFSPDAAHRFSDNLCNDSPLNAQ